MADIEQFMVVCDAFSLNARLCAVSAAPETEIWRRNVLSFWSKNHVTSTRFLPFGKDGGGWLENKRSEGATSFKTAATLEVPG